MILFINFWLDHTVSLLVLFSICSLHVVQVGNSHSWS